MERPGEDGSGGLQGHCGGEQALPAAPPAGAGMRRLGRRPRPREPESRRPCLSHRLPPPIGSALSSPQPCREVGAARGGGMSARSEG